MILGEEKRGRSLFGGESPAPPGLMFRRASRGWATHCLKSSVPGGQP